jgi:hypothetical protein
MVVGRFFGQKDWVRKLGSFLREELIRARLRSRRYIVNYMRRLAWSLEM